MNHLKILGLSLCLVCVAFFGTVSAQDIFFSPVPKVDVVHRAGCSTGESPTKRVAETMALVQAWENFAAAKKELTDAGYSIIKADYPKLSGVRWFGGKDPAWVAHACWHIKGAKIVDPDPVDEEPSSEPDILSPSIFSPGYGF